MTTAGPSGEFVFDDGAAYEQMMGRWSALVARPFLDWLQLPAGLDWLDAGCGDGSFTRVLVEAQMPRSVTGVDPAPAQLAFARQRVVTATVRFVEGDAQALPLEDRCVDAAVMALVLFFLPDPLLGVREMVRVCRPGGLVAAYHWDLAGGGLPLQPILDAARRQGHDSPMPQSAWASSLTASADLWQDAGLTDVQTSVFEVRRRFDDFEAYWRSALGSPRLRQLSASLDAGQLREAREWVMQQLQASSDGHVEVTARANAVKGRTPA